MLKKLGYFYATTWLIFAGPVTYVVKVVLSSNTISLSSLNTSQPPGMPTFKIEVFHLVSNVRTTD